MNVCPPHSAVTAVSAYTAQQTLTYLQALYEKKLCTYPRTDSRYLTEDMKGNGHSGFGIAVGRTDRPEQGPGHQEQDFPLPRGQIANVDAGGGELGWRAYANKEPSEDAALPEGLTQDAALTAKEVRVKEGKTAPPKHFTEDTILASM